jgi:hypothetical protein
MEMRFEPEKYGLLQSRRRRCEIVLLRSGFATAVEKLPFLAVKRRCDPISPPKRQSLIVDRSWGAPVAFAA